MSRAPESTAGSDTAEKTFVTYPSISMTIFEVPEPKDIDGSFKYNYFLSDERESENTFVNDDSIRSNGGRYARQVNLSFTPLNDITPNFDLTTKLHINESQREIILNTNIDKITKETDFDGNKNVSLKLQDTTVAQDLLADVEAFLRKKKVDTFALSPMETLLRYSSQTTENMDGQAMLDSVNVDDFNEYVTINPVTGEPFEVKKEGDIGKLTFNLVASKRFAYDIATTAIKTPLSPSSSKFSSAIDELLRIQNKGRSSISSAVLQRSDFVQSYDTVQTFVASATDVFLGGNTVMGYHITRTNLGNDDDIRHFFISNTSADSFSDTEVLYGATYSYAISVVYMFRFFTFDESARTVFSDVLIESRESPSISVTCEEIIPPSAPEDLRFYMLQNGELMLEWAFPLNKQKDIKRFQIFKRSSIQEPFVLIGELDFDDSTIQTARSENVYERAVSKIDTSVTYFNDPFFDLDSKFIYAICAVDAHDLSSPYSEQFMVSYDKNSAMLTTELVSEKNAPKPYPNFLLRNELLENVAKDSNHQKLCLYFDPEYLQVINGQGTKLDFIQSSEVNASYKLQLIHLNFQQSVVADIKINK